MTREEQYQTIIERGDPIGYVNRILIATPSTGIVRMEWVVARYGQVVPVNWSVVTMLQYINGYIPMYYQVADAQNLIVKEVIEKKFQWLFLLEHDVMPPEDTFIRLNAYISERKIPVVSGLYFTRSEPSEPLIFRGRGGGVYKDFKIGDLIWADGTPTGCLLIHASILEAMWKESPEYDVRLPNGQRVITRRIFETPRERWQDPETGYSSQLSGTSDLQWCTRVMEEGFFAKSGWPKFQNVKYPFLIDTNINCRHIDMDGTQYPDEKNIKPYFNNNRRN